MSLEFVIAAFFGTRAHYTYPTVYEDDELTEQKKRVEKEIKRDTNDVAISHAKLE